MSGVHIDESAYPADLPMGGYHHDADSNTTYRLAKSLTDDYYIGKDTNGDWFATLGVGQPPIAITDAMMMAGIHLSATARRPLTNTEGGERVNQDKRLGSRCID